MRKTQSPVFLGQQPSAVHGRMVGLGDGVQVFLPGSPGSHIQMVQLQDAVLDGVGQLKVYDAPEPTSTTWTASSRWSFRSSTIRIESPSSSRVNVSHTVPSGSWVCWQMGEVPEEKKYWLSPMTTITWSNPLASLSR